MNKIVYFLIFIAAFLTGNYLLLLAIPIMAWVYGGKKRRSANRKKSRSRADFVNFDSAS